MLPDEKTAWDTLLLNRLNPAHWKFISMTTGITASACFKSKVTHDILFLIRETPVLKKKQRRLE